LHPVQPAAVGGRELMDLLRFSTAGSVDDGKSTLIGRLLYDSKGIFEDQLAAIERTSQRRGYSQVDLALLTDGLRAEREQGITIDVAYRYFATPRRKFIIADTPGHVQYTRNMVTGASTADLAVILIDARNGVLEQSRRHAFISTLLGIPHLVVAVNKMDLVGYSEEVFDAIQQEFAAWAQKLDVHDIQFIPISALHGDNVVTRSLSMPWYQGPSLLYHLEHVYIGSDRNLIDARFPVQWIIRPQTDEYHDYRGYAGEIASGTFSKGDEVMVLPSGQRTRIKRIETFDGELEVAGPPLSVSILLEDDVDISRGDMLCRPHNQPTVANELDAMVCWMTDAPLRERGRYLLKHTTRTVKALVDELRYRIDVNTLHRDQDADQLGLNEIGRVRFRAGAPLLLDPYDLSRTTGGFVLIDETTYDTVGAGMVVHAGPEQQQAELEEMLESIDGDSGAALEAAA
jgi:bifunctional enzyme CysN/CysC